MKVAIDFTGPPFFLAHGGAQTQVNETVKALRDEGVDVEYARWWDGGQKADIIHSFGVPNSTYIDFARSKGIPVLNTTLFTATCNRSRRFLDLQGFIMSSLLKMPGIPPWSSIRPQLIWDCFKKCDLNIVGLDAETEVLQRVYGVSKNRIGIVPLGLADRFLEAGHGSRESKYLITTGTITERKRSLELARMAHAERVPICFVGKPYDPDGDYWKEFSALIDGSIVKHIPHTDSVEEMIDLLKQSRGYVLYSDYENWCLSAHEAIACGLPILVPGQPWSRERFGSQAHYFEGRNEATNGKILSAFHNQCESLPVPDVPLLSWRDVARDLIVLYKRALS